MIGKNVLAAGLVALAAGTALGSPQESTTFLNVVSNACSGCAENDVRTWTFTGGYPVGALRVSGTLTENAAASATFGTEARILVTPPVGTPFVVQASTITSWTGTLVVSETINPTNAGITDAAGEWTFRFYESLDDGTAFVYDAIWDSITITLDDQPEPTITTLTPTAGVYTEVEPNDWTYVGNRISAMAPGDKITGTTTGTATITAGATSSDNFLVTTTTAPLGIYRNRLALTTTGTAGHVGSIRALVQANQSTAGFPGMLAKYSDSYRTAAGTAQTSITTAPIRTVQWYSFGKGETLEYRVTGTTSTTAPYEAAFVRDPVSPIVVAGTLVPGSVTINRGTGNTTAIDMWLYDANLNPIAAAGSEGNNTLTRTLTAGTYYLAVSNVNTANNQPTPGDSTTRTSVALNRADMITNSSSTTVANMNMNFVHGGGTASGTGAKAGAFDIVWYQFTVGTLDNPVASGQATPSTVNVNKPTKFTVAVTPADAANNNIVSVIADASTVGLSGSLQLFDDGPGGGHGDAVLGDNIFTRDVVIPLNAPSLGALVVTAVATDAGARTANANINITLTDTILGTCCVSGNAQSLTERNCATAGGTYLGDDPVATNLPGAIADTSPPVVSTLTFTDSRIITGIKVRMRINHTWVGDLICTLSNGTRTVTLFNRPGVGVAASTVGFNVDLLSTGDYVFADGEANFWSACQAAAGATLPPGSYAPVSDQAVNTLSNLGDFIGDPVAGTWTLTISDNAGGDTGTLSAWSIEFTPNVSCGPTACSIADIATEGNPDVQAGPDGFITGVDADAFIECFNNLTRKKLPADPPAGPFTGPYIADVIGDLGVGPPNGFVEGVDADAFFEAYFVGC